MQMPIVNLAGAPRDWRQEQPFGVYRCVNGWNSGPAEYHCQNQGVVESKNGDLYCYPCAMVLAIGDNTAAIREETESANERAARADELTCAIITSLEDMQFSLADIAWCSYPGWFRCLARMSTILRRRKRTTKTQPTPPVSAEPATE